MDRAHELEQLATNIASKLSAEDIAKMRQAQVVSRSKLTDEDFAEAEAEGVPVIVAHARREGRGAPMADLTAKVEALEARMAAMEAQVGKR